ncbi:hypothetical protein SNE25_11640 [Mucilaginibacter sabulilitoris]|uniref:Uncharacterized protein n=1 Tax=Mucilaginibacter sabulilitoris TaxID=1173583 RepID=A0ABZ0TXG4_9SPHI|nr:hypothetical protein [Mucilaginibacter sabulilitoris]WPU96170.1 hypothetical protein SNE25_11640 [Mucilaginibacter sabulilitoris]
MNRFKILIIGIQIGYRLSSFGQSLVNTNKVLHQYLNIQQKSTDFNCIVLITKNERTIYKEGFYGKKVNIQFTFKVDQERRVTSLLADGRGQIITFIKK